MSRVQAKRSANSRPLSHPEAIITNHSIPVSHNDEGVISEVVELTPAWAMELLGHNPTNRNINKSLVERIANDIVDGNWEFNGEAVIVSDKDNLLDGQHRCHAVIMANKPVKVLLVYGVPESRFKSIDKGTSRTNANVLEATKIPHSRAVAAAAAIVNAIETGNSDIKFRNKKGILAFVKEHPELVSSAQFAYSMTNTRRLIQASVITAMHALMSKKDSDEADDFWRKVISGEDIRSGMPEFWLREYLLSRKGDAGMIGMREKYDRATQQHLSCLSILAWNKRRGNEELRTAPRWSFSERGFPEIK